jgi:hypothetical protein
MASDLDEPALERAARDAAGGPEEAQDLLQWAKPTGMLTREELLIALAKSYRDVRKELKRQNDIMADRDKTVKWLIQHTGDCISRFFDAISTPRILFPLFAMAAFLTLFVMGYGDRAMDLLESGVEHYMGFDVHGHGDDID